VVLVVICFPTTTTTTTTTSQQQEKGVGPMEAYQGRDSRLTAHPTTATASADRNNRPTLREGPALLAVERAKASFPVRELTLLLDPSTPRRVLSPHSVDVFYFNYHKKIIVLFNLEKPAGTLP